MSAKIYPWKKWLNRKRRLTLIRGTDYDCQPHSMAQQFRNAALREGVTVSIAIDGKTITVTNQGEV